MPRSGRTPAVRRTRPPTAAHARGQSPAQRRILDERAEGGRQRRRILWRAQRAVLAIHHEIQQPAHAARNHRHTARQRFDGREAERFEMRRLDQHVARPQQRRHVRHRSQKPDRRVQVVFLHKRPGRRPDVPRMIVHVGTRDEQDRATWTAQAPRLQQIHQALLPAQPAEKETGDRPGRHAEPPPEIGTLGIGRRRERCHVDGVRQVVHTVSGNAAAEGFALDFTRDAREGVRAAVRRSNRPFHQTRHGARAGEAPAFQHAVDVVARQHAGGLRLHHGGTACPRARGEHAQGHAAIVHTAHDVVRGRVPHKPRRHKRHHLPFAGRGPRPGGPDSLNLDASKRGAIRQRAIDPFGDDAHGVSRIREIQRQPLGVAFNAAHDGPVVRRDDDHPRVRHHHQ